MIYCDGSLADELVCAYRSDGVIDGSGGSLKGETYPISTHVNCALGFAVPLDVEWQFDTSIVVVIPAIFGRREARKWCGSGEAKQWRLACLTSGGDCANCSNSRHTRNRFFRERWFWDS